MITIPSPSPVSAIPPDIAKGILLVKKDVKTIAHDAENRHGNYKYASVDAIYEGVREVMATHGLGLLLLETGFAQVGEKSIRFSFQWVLFSVESTWTHEQAQRTIILPWNGPQTAQAAQSYVEKAVLKSLFKLQTGDAEPEGHELGEAPKPTGKASGKKAPAPDVDVSVSRTKTATIQADLNASYPDKMSAQDAADFAEKWGADFSAMTETDKDGIRNAIKARRAAVK